MFSFRFSLRLKLASIIVLSGLCAAMLPAQQAPITTIQQATPHVTKAPYLIFPGQNTQMMVLWQTNYKAPGKLAWGLDEKVAQGALDSAEYGDDHQHKEIIKDLKPGQLYHYRVTTLGQTFKGTFRAAPPEDATDVSFYNYGDTRSHPDAHDSVCKAVVADYKKDLSRQTLLLFTGDFVFNGDSEPFWTREFFDPALKNMQEEHANLPLMSAMGNHEAHGLLFQKYWPYPFVAARYYSLDYGPVHAAFVDSYTTYSQGSAQLEWLEKDLASSKKPWKFIVIHEPAWSALGGHQNSLGAQQFLQPLCKKYAVAAILGGHNHYYARAVVDGVQHITSGGGGAPLYDFDPKAPYLVTATKTLEFCRIDIHGDTLHGIAITPEGKVIDDFTMQQPTPAR